MSESKQQQKFDPFVRPFTHPETGKNESVKVYRPHSKYCLAWAEGAREYSTTGACILIATGMLIDALYWMFKDLYRALGVTAADNETPEGDLPNPFAKSEEKPKATRKKASSKKKE